VQPSASCVCQLYHLLLLLLLLLFLSPRSHCAGLSTDWSQLLLPLLLQCSAYALC
jgi:hypothetical protein